MGNPSLLKAKPKKPKDKDIANLLEYKAIIVSDLWSQSPLPYVSLSGVHSQWLIKNQIRHGQFFNTNYTAVLVSVFFDQKFHIQVLWFYFINVNFISVAFQPLYKSHLLNSSVKNINNYEIILTYDLHVHLSNHIHNITLNHMMSVLFPFIFILMA